MPKRRMSANSFAKERRFMALIMSVSASLVGSVDDGVDGFVDDVKNGR